MRSGKLKDVVYRLVVEQHFLPLAPASMLSMLPSSLVCTSVECIVKRAVEVLTRADEDSEVYRQLILALSYRTAVSMTVQNFKIALLKARFLRKPFASELYNEIAKIRSEDVVNRAVHVYADLTQLNFAYVSVDSIILDCLSVKRSKTPRTLTSTLQSRALISRMPLKPFVYSIVDPSDAENIVKFCISLRQKVIEGFLKLRPLKACDIFHYVYQWAKKEAEKLEKYHHLVKMLDRSIYEELFTAPYYLKHYGLINFDIIWYELFWNLGGQV
jgi:hypothetical protein